MDYKNADMYALMCERDKCAAELAKYAKSGLSLDLSRGKPAAEQLALSLNMLDVLDHRSILDSESGQDCRNYGGLDGIEEAKRLLSHMMGTHSVNTIVGGNSSGADGRSSRRTCGSAACGTLGGRTCTA